MLKGEMYVMKNSVLTTDFWGTPCLMEAVAEVWVPRSTNCFPSLKYDSTALRKFLDDFERFDFRL